MRKTDDILSRIYLEGLGPLLDELEELHEDEEGQMWSGSPDDSRDWYDHDATLRRIKALYDALWEPESTECRGCGEIMPVTYRGLCEACNRIAESVD